MFDWIIFQFSSISKNLHELIKIENLRGSNLNCVLFCIVENGVSRESLKQAYKEGLSYKIELHKRTTTAKIDKIHRILEKVIGPRYREELSL